ncbi:MAG: VTT domain-containing protein [Lachnospiraceae bacterium]|jgi:uncharacterized membrane protein YdjX (TVP38/TMEM64 family)|nr:VTT domain-containing protein [Lachnospiraceae bacterium]
MNIWQNSVWYKVLRVLGIIGAVAATVWLFWQAFGSMLPQLVPLLREGNSDDIALYLRDEGQWKGMLCTFALAFIQAVSIFLPGMCVQIAAGAIYGWFQGFIICFLGYWCANIVVFLFARRFKTSISGKVSTGKRTLWLMEKLKSTSPGFVVAIACLIPGIPNGIIPYLAARSRIKVKQFAEAVAAGCWITILSFCMTGRFLLQGKYMYGVLAVAVQIAVIIFVLVKRDWFLTRIQGRETHRKKEEDNKDGTQDD